MKDPLCVFVQCWNMANSSWHTIVFSNFEVFPRPLFHFIHFIPSLGSHYLNYLYIFCSEHLSVAILYGCFCFDAKNTRHRSMMTASSAEDETDLLLPLVKWTQRNALLSQTLSLENRSTKLEDYLSGPWCPHDIVFFSITFFWRPPMSVQKQNDASVLASVSHPFLYVDGTGTKCTTSWAHVVHSSANFERLSSTYISTSRTTAAIMTEWRKRDTEAIAL